MSSCDLSILCVTKAEPHSLRFLAEMNMLAVELGAEFVPVADGEDARLTLADVSPRIVESNGFIESVLDEAVSFCSRGYVLRLDDDESCSRGMIRWLMEGAYQTTSLWKFPRVHLWGDVQHALVTPALYPDQQQRLSLKELAGGRHEIHSGSPYGSGEWAPCSVEHHKFLVRSLHDRRSIIQRYDGIRRGAGSQFKEWQTPEDVYSPAELATKVVEWDGETLTRRAA